MSMINDKAKAPQGRDAFSKFQVMSLYMTGLHEMIAEEKR
jgi:hypothetical protein